MLKNIFIYSSKSIVEVAVIESNRYKESDIIHLHSAMSIKTFPKKSKKGNCVDRENQRPNFNACSYSISCDFDSQYGFNFRLPLWMRN